MIIFFDGPDRSRKTTLAKAISGILEIPYWERGSYLPHHSRGTKKLEGQPNVELHGDDAIWYVVDELKTIETFKKIGGNVIVDRHPRVSECVYRRLEGRPSNLEYDRMSSSKEFVVLCQLGTEDQQTIDVYKTVLKHFSVDYAVIDTGSVDSLDKTIELVYQIAERVR